MAGENRGRTWGEQGENRGRTGGRTGGTRTEIGRVAPLLADPASENSTIDTETHPFGYDDHIFNHIMVGRHQEELHQ